MSRCPPCSCVLAHACLSMSMFMSTSPHEAWPTIMPPCPCHGCHLWPPMTYPHHLTFCTRSPPPHQKKKKNIFTFFSLCFCFGLGHIFYFLRFFFYKNNGERWNDGCAMTPPPPLHHPIYLNSRISTKLNTLRDTIDSWNTCFMHKVGLEIYMYKWGV